MAAEMTTGDELRLIADSVTMMLPFQAARLHVLAARVDEIDHGNAIARGTTAACATTVSSVPRGARSTTS